jgi:hypothetical protein
MTASVVGSPTYTGGGASTVLAAGLPSTPAVGNLLVLVLSFWSTAPSTPSGWTQQALTTLDTSMRQGIYTKVVVGSEGSSVSFTGFVADDPRSSLVLNVTNHNGVDVATAMFGDAEVPMAAPSITTTVDDTLVINSCFCQCDAAGSGAYGDFASGTTLSKAVSGPVGGYTALSALATLVKTTAGATGTNAVAVTGTGATASWAGSAIAIKAGVAAPDAPTGYIFNGSAWVASATPRMFNGSAWVTTPAIPIS